MKGLYSITCEVNGKVYVGQSTNVKQRVSHQKSVLTSKIFNKKGVNHRLYRDVQEHGWEKFKVKIYKVNGNKDLKDLEYEMMCKLNSLHPNGYNLRSDYKGRHIPHPSTVKLFQEKDTTGENNSNFGNHWSEEMKERMSHIAKSRHESGDIYDDEWKKKIGKAVSDFWRDPKNIEVKKRMAENVSKAKDKYYVIKMDMQGRELDRYSSMEDATTKNQNFKAPGIYKACEGRRPHYRGFKWKRQLKI